jgi:hypothetical protein
LVNDALSSTRRKPQHHGRHRPRQGGVMQARELAFTHLALDLEGDQQKEDRYQPPSNA